MSSIGRSKEEKYNFKDRLKIILDNDMIVVYFGCFITDGNQILRAIKAVHAHLNQLFMCSLALCMNDFHSTHFVVCCY